MLDETGMLGTHKQEQPKPQPPKPQPQPQPQSGPAPARELPKIFSPDKMSPTEMAGAGIVMVGNIAFVSWWAMNQEPSEEVAEVMETSSGIATDVINAANLDKPADTSYIVPPLPQPVAEQSGTAAPILEVAEVNQEVPFKEAFDTARAQVGPGGIFEWHGQWYNTYTSEEWTGMTPEIRNDYVSLVQPYVEGDQPMPDSSLEDALSGHRGHVEVAHVEHAQPHHHDDHQGHLEQTAGLVPPTDSYHLDSLDDLFTNT
ncbi:hypothetical protein [Runella sp.]|uniref:hypothetical protein n=1 Tax=Runella sp. TaxID=1960881 RepID=UPI003D142745